MPDLEALYKSKLDHSHGEGLQAVFAAGHALGVAETKTKYERDFEARQAAKDAPEGETSDEEKDGESDETKEVEDTEAPARRTRR